MTVILADDHTVVRKGILKFLEEPGDIAIAAEASNGDEALDAIRQHRPDVAVLDIQMPERTALEVTRAVRTEQLHVGALILTAYEDDPFVVTAPQAGANGYVLKTAEPEEIVAAVRAVQQGQSALDPAVLDKVLAQLTSASPPIALLVKRCAWPPRASITRRSVSRWASDTELALYRIIQAALQNTVRHSCASKVSVSIEHDEGITMQVRDDGTGFVVPQRLSDLVEAGHYGLMGMQERAQLVGALLSVTSQPGNGAKVSVRWVPADSDHRVRA